MIGLFRGCKHIEASNAGRLSSIWPRDILYITAGFSRFCLTAEAISSAICPTSKELLKNNFCKVISERLLIVF